ncbi:MAG TPA: NAD(P)H-dependent oxidoreductase [Gemmatimonadaceae bacterium]
MDTKEAPRIALIIGSTRPNRFADVPARWIGDGAARRHDLALEPLDLRDWPLPFYREPESLRATGGVYSDPVAERWRHKIGEFDGFIATAAEYNHGPTAVLKNALDSALNEWIGKPIAFVGYGGVGGARAVEQLRMIAVELQMAPIKEAVHIGLEPFLGVLRDGKTLDDYEFLVQSRSAMLDQLVWWARALKAARDASAVAESAAA